MQGGMLVIPENLKEQWALVQARAEVIFLADHGGGYPECLSMPGMTLAARRVALRRLGFRVAKEYTMPRDISNLDEPDKARVPWVRLTNDMGVELETGWVIRTARPAQKRGGTSGGGESS